MSSNIDLSGATQAATFSFSANNGPSDITAVYSVGGGSSATVANVGNVVGTNFGDQITLNLGQGNTFELSSFVGGTGVDTLTVGGRGAYNLAGVTGVENYSFGNTGITMPDSVFTNVASGTINVNIFSGTQGGGQSFDGSGIAAGHNLVITVNLTSYIPITGGAGDDVFYGNLLAGGGETLHGGLGHDSAFLVIDSATFTGNAGSPEPLGAIDGVEYFQFVDATSHATYYAINNQNFVGVTGNLITAALDTFGGELDASALSASNSVWLIGSAANDILKGGAGNDVFQFAAGQLSATDVVTGGGGADSLLASGTGVIPVSGVSGVGYYLIQGGGSITLTDANFANLTGYLGVNDYNGGTINGSAVSAGHNLYLLGSTSPDFFTGGAGNDVFQFSAGQLSTEDFIAGGGGSDILLISSSGTINSENVSGVSFYELASSGANNLALTTANLAGLSIFGVQAGSGGDTLDASGVTSTGTQTYLFGGVGNDTLKAGADNTILVSNGGNDTMVGGSGADVFAPSASGISTITTFRSGTDVLFFSDALFDLGASEGGNSAFGHLDASAFSTATDGSFTTTQQRFAFDSATHDLFYAAQGSATASGAIHEIALLSGVSTLSANDLFYGH